AGLPWRSSEGPVLVGYGESDERSGHSGCKIFVRAIAIGPGAGGFRSPWPPGKARNTIAPGARCRTRSGAVGNHTQERTRESPACSIMKFRGSEFLPCQTCAAFICPQTAHNIFES